MQTDMMTYLLNLSMSLARSAFTTETTLLLLHESERKAICRKNVCKTVYLKKWYFISVQKCPEMV